MLEDTLVRREIGYQVIGGTKFYERAEIKDAIAYLTLLGNPQDAVELPRASRTRPRRGIGQTSLSRVLTHADTMGISDLGRGGRRRRRSRASGPRRSRRSGASWTRWRACGERAEQQVPIGDLLEAVLHETGYLDALEAERTIEAQGRLENLEELVERRPRVRRARRPRARTRSTSSCSRSRSSPTPTRGSDDEGLVTLMTLHNAKGLEYPVVFMIGCEEGVFPHSRSLDEGDLEEERRLCYVGDHARDARPLR